MNITVWSNFSKRINSTKQPAANTGTIKTVLLKDATDIEAPVFELNTVDFSINYVQAFGHYYFCDVRNLDGSRSELVCSMDHLATFKDNIKAYSGLVEYTSSSSRVDITDPRNKPTCDVSVGTPGFYSIWSCDNNGVYILGVINNSGNSAGGFPTYYAMTKSQMSDFCQKIFDQSLWQQVVNQYKDIIDSIVSCHWLPINNISSLSVAGGDETITIGDAPLTGCSGKRITNRVYSNSVFIGAVNHYQAKGETYLCRAPYTTGYVYLPFVGVVECPVDLMDNAATVSLQCDYSLDVLTGDVIYDLKQTGLVGNLKLTSYSGNMASKVPVSGAGYDGIGFVGGMMTAIGGLAAAVGAIATGGAGVAVAGAAAAGLGGVGAAVKSLESKSMINGSISSGLGWKLGTDIIIYLLTRHAAEENLTAFQAKHGMPYFKVATLSSLSGYIQCADASVEIPGTAAEKTAVNGYLNSGFYLE